MQARPADRVTYQFAPGQLRNCKTCQHLKRPEIDRRFAAGEPSAQVARDYELNPSSLHRHRANCLKLASSNAIMKDAARGTAAVALLPSKETLSGAYFELRNRSRVLALPGSDDSIRGLTVDGWIVADEAARLPDDLIAALRPMRARRPEARFAMLSTAWSLTDPFWTAWSSEDSTWIRLRATADVDLNFNPEVLEQERHALGEAAYKREYLGIPTGAGTSPFTWVLFEKITRSHTPLVPPGPAFFPPEPEPAKPAENPFQRLSGGLIQ